MIFFHNTNNFIIRLTNDKETVVKCYISYILMIKSLVTLLLFIRVLEYGLKYIDISICITSNMNKEQLKGK